MAHGQTLVQIQSVGVAYRAALAISILCVIGAGTTTAVRADVGARGWVTTAIGTRFDQANAVARQPNGRLVVAGSSDRTGFAVARYLPSGVLDASFGRGGIVRTAVYDGASALAIQPDGKIVLAGNTVDRFALARYTSDGRLDKNFGRGGRTTTAFGDFANAYALVRQPDGKLVVAGSQSRATGGDTFALARYNVDGSLDSTFGHRGRVTTSFGEYGADARALVRQPDGRLVAAGDSKSGFTLVRYFADGRIDPSFGRSGTAIASFGTGGAHLYALLLAPMASSSRADSPHLRESRRTRTSPSLAIPRTAASTRASGTAERS